MTAPVKMTTFALLFTGIFLNAIAQLLLKVGTNTVGAIHLTAQNWVSIGIKLATQAPIIGGLFCYTMAVLVWIIGLSRVDVMIAYPMLAIGYIVNAIGAWYFLGEAMSMQRISAIGMILAGVVLLQFAPASEG